MYNIVNHLCPNYLSMYVKYRPVSIQNLRRNSQLLVPFPHKEIFKKSLQCSGAFKWNALPSELKEAPSYGIFKINVRFLSSTNVHFMINISEFIMILF